MANAIQPLSTQSHFFSNTESSYVLASLGAFGVALQNYQGVLLCLNGLLSTSIPASRGLNWCIQLTALATGGLCSGMVNFWMNIELLDNFSQRIHSSDEEYQYQRLQLSPWQMLQYMSGLLVFVVTGLLFGLMAFTFAMEGPLSLLSIAAGLFVAAIMTVQEVETWLSSYDNTNTIAAALTPSQKWGQSVGQAIAIGNVFALSLLFTLSLAQSLIALQIATNLALTIGFAVAFTFGTFTEYYFYHFYLSQFCAHFSDHWDQMNHAPNAEFGLLCVITNALVNAALTYSGVQLLIDLMCTTPIGLPLLITTTAIAATSALFAGSASLILGMDFWIRSTDETPEEQQSTSLTL